MSHIHAHRASRTGRFRSLPALALAAEPMVGTARLEAPLIGSSWVCTRRAVASEGASTASVGVTGRRTMRPAGPHSSGVRIGGDREKALAHGTCRGAAPRSTGNYAACRAHCSPEDDLRVPANVLVFSGLADPAGRSSESYAAYRPHSSGENKPVEAGKSSVFSTLEDKQAGPASEFCGFARRNQCCALGAS